MTPDLPAPIAAYFAAANARDLDATIACFPPSSPAAPAGIAPLSDAALRCTVEVYRQVEHRPCVK